MERRLVSFQKRIYKFLKSAGDLDDPTPALADQMVASLQSVFLHASTAGERVDLEACELTLEALASTLNKAERADTTSSKECITDVFDFQLKDVSGSMVAKFEFSFHRPILWVWRELLLTMLASGLPNDAVLASARRCLLAPPLYDASDWRTRSRHTIDLVLRGGSEDGYDGVDHRNDDGTEVQKKQLHKLQQLCEAHAEQLKFDKYDTYEHNNDESDDESDEDDDQSDDDE